jgi:hypothetical protein
LPTCNRRACQFQKPIGVVATKPKDEPRWNNARPDAVPEDKKAKPNASYSGQGLEIKEKFLHFRLREKNVLDIPSYRAGDCNRLVRSTKKGSEGSAEEIELKLRL